MPNQPRQDPAALKFGRDEWELLVTLPRRVLMAASAAEPPERRGVAEGIAGIEAIASGLSSSSQLVREVVGSIYSESHREPDELAGEGEVGILQALAACRYASELVGARTDTDDARAYREWLRHIAAVVTGVAQGMSVDRPAGRVALAETRFLYALDGVLRP
jgi:hypothetical protein